LRHFQEVAKLYSEDKAKDGTENSSALIPQVCHRTIDADLYTLGGRLGERTKGSLLAEFEKVAYTLKPEKSPNGRIHIGEAKTEHGYHLIVVEERK
jgi:NIMA-interacting peptidyl-prolyl cis-trans isomerase 4